MQPLTMDYEESESARDNFGKFIHQFQPETKTLIRKFKRILIKLYRQNMSLLFNQTCLNEQLQPNYISSKSKVGDCNQGRPESSLYNSYYTKV